MPKPPVDFPDHKTPSLWEGSASNAPLRRRGSFLAFAVFFVVGFALAYGYEVATR